MICRTGSARASDRRHAAPLVVDRLTPEEEPIPVVTAGPRLLATLLRGESESGERLHERALAKDAGASFALDRLQAGHALQLGVRVTREDTFNVVASVEGTDPVLRSEFIALGAHLDHSVFAPPGRVERREEPPRRPAGDRHQQRRRRRRIGRGGARGDGGGGDARSEAEAVAAVRLAHGRGKRRLGLALHHGVSAGAASTTSSRS